VLPNVFRAPSSTPITRAPRWCHRMSQLGMLDATGAHTLAQISTEWEARGITVIIKGVRPEHMNVLTNVGVIDSLRHKNHLLDSLDDAVGHARTHVAHQPH
jgi:sulfate permease, SulP family